jgi:hypothetical protein
MGDLTMRKELLRKQERTVKANLPFGVAGVEAISGSLSPATDRRYGMRMATQEWEIALSTLHATGPRAHAKPAGKPGPRTKLSKPELTTLSAAAPAASRALFAA